MAHPNGSAVTYFPKYRQYIAKPALTRFLRSPIIAALRALGELHHFVVVSERCGLEDTHGVVLHMHWFVVSTSNKPSQTREAHFKCQKIRPSNGLFRQKNFHIEKGKILLNFNWLICL